MGCALVHSEIFWGGLCFSVLFLFHFGFFVLVLPVIMHCFVYLHQNAPGVGLFGDGGKCFWHCAL